MNKKIDARQLQKDIDKLGILAIAVFDALSLECMQDVVDFVKTINIDFAKLAAESRLKRKISEK